jgi:hypothetical protein
MLYLALKVPGEFRGPLGARELKGTPEAKIIIAIRRFVVVAIRGTQVLRVIVPTTPAIHAIGTRGLFGIPQLGAMLEQNPLAEMKTMRLGDPAHNTIHLP